MFSGGPSYSGGDGTSIYSAPIKPYTFTGKPTTGATGDQIYITDIGEYGAIYTWNGTAWKHTGSIEIMQRAKGWIAPALAAANAATYSQSGTTITVTSTGHNIPDLKYNTKDVYLNMGTAATGATIPPGWFSNFTYVSADSFTCTSTVSQTGTGAVNTNLAEITITDLSCVINGGALGLNGVTTHSYLFSNNSSATVKSARFYFGTNAVIQTASTNTFIGAIYLPISNRNNLSSQATVDETGMKVFSQDTSVDVPCSFSIQCAAANDFAAIHSAAVYISPS